MKKVVIDRFEGEMAVCERADKTTFNIAKQLLPPEAREGDVLIMEDDRICIDIEETQKRRVRVEKMMKRIQK